MFGVVLFIGELAPLCMAEGPKKAKHVTFVAHDFCMATSCAEALRNAHVTFVVAAAVLVHGHGNGAGNL